MGIVRSRRSVFDNSASVKVRPGVHAISQLRPRCNLRSTNNLRSVSTNIGCENGPNSRWFSKREENREEPTGHEASGRSGSRASRFVHDEFPDFQKGLKSR